MSKYIRAYLDKYHPKRLTLLLNDNDLGDQRASLLLSSFYDHPEITCINLSCNTRLALGSDRTCASLVKLIGFRRLMHLNCTALRLGNRSVEKILTAMQGNASIRSLRLADNDLRGVRLASAIADMMQAYNQQVEELDLAWNDFGPDEGIIIARAIDDESPLKILNLAGNSIAGAAAEQGEMLARSKLEKLDISYTQMCGSELQLVAVGLAQSSTMRRINLSGNALGETGMRAVVPLLVTPPKDLHCTFKLWDCDFRIEDQAADATFFEPAEVNVDVLEKTVDAVRRRGGVVDADEPVDDETIDHLL